MLNANFGVNLLNIEFRSIKTDRIQITLKKREIQVGCPEYLTNSDCISQYEFIGMRKDDMIHTLIVKPVFPIIFDI